MNAHATPPAPGSATKRKRALILLVMLIILFGLISLVYWFLALRHHQQTDDAYVAGNQLQIMSQVPGSINKVWFDNTDYVKQGDILASIDKTDALLAVEKAQTALATTIRQTHQMMINSKQYLASITLQRTALDQAKADLKRREPLAQSSLIGREELQHARDSVAIAEARLEVATQQYNANEAIILRSQLENQPAVKQSAAALRDAWLALQRTEIRSPATGYVAQRNVQVGSRITTASPLMAIVPADNLWINANFKETQLADVRIGQPATVISDLYGNNVTYHGKVAGLDMGTGSAFSLLPAQNATGNWIKVVQRLPVRIALDAEEIRQHPLRIGLSTQVTIDTTNQEGDVLANQVRSTPAYESNALTLDLTPVNQMIATIIHDNASE